MKHSILTFIALLAFVSLSYSQSEGIVWEKDFKKAQQLARQTGRPLLLDFTADWCKPCEVMDKEFWVLAEVVAATKPFVAVKVDYDNSKGLNRKYGVQAIPFVVFADPLGNMVTFRRGFSRKSVGDLNRIFDEMPKDFSPLTKYYDRLDLNKDDGLALYEIAGAYRGAKMYYLSAQFYKDALKTPEIQGDAERRTNCYLSAGANYLNSNSYKEAIEILEDFLKTQPPPESRETALYFLTVGNAWADKMKNAEKYLTVLKTEFPGSATLEKAEAVIRNVKNSPKKEK